MSQWSGLLIEVSDAVCGLVDDGVGNFSVARSYPDWDLELTQSEYQPRVDVVPAGIKVVEFTSRDTVKLLCSVDIVMRCRFSQTDKESQTGGVRIWTVDDLVEATESMLIKLCKYRRIGNEQRFDGWLESVEAKTTTDPNHLRSKQFTSQLKAYYAVTRTIEQANC